LNLKILLNNPYKKQNIYLQTYNAAISPKILLTLRKGGILLPREGLIPTVLGTAVTTAGLALRKANPVFGWGVAGFGLAHILLGAIDMIEHPPE